VFGQRRRGRSTLADDEDDDSFDDYEDEYYRPRQEYD
jgi:hypothetical protein